MSQKKIKVSRNTNIINKTNHHLSSEFHAVELTPDELIDSIAIHGYAHSNIFQQNQRKNDNFKSSQVIQIDFDGQLKLNEAVGNSLIRDKAYFLYTTPSHKEGVEDRFRVVYLSDFSIESKTDYEYCVKGLLSLLKEADQACKDPARFFFGCTEARITKFGNYFSKADIEMFVKVGKQVEEKTKSISYTKKAKNHPRLNIEEIREILKFINPNPGYETWRNIIWSLCSEFDPLEVKSLVNEWSPDTKNNGQHLDTLITCYNGTSIGFGTLMHHAIKGGYQSKNQLMQKRTEGQVALEDLFSNGYGVKTYLKDLYIYDSGYYRFMNDDEAQSIISKHFNIYETRPERNGLASSKKVKDALEFVKMKTSITEKGLFKGTGINLKNGFLSLKLNGNEVIQKLERHSPDRVILDKIDIDYDPEFNTNIFDEAINEILPKEHQEILLKTIAAAFNLPGVRSKLPRGVKALILVGDGANGKDTLRVWVESLFGNDSISHIPIQAFKDADKGKLFGIQDLINSKLNWPSENVQTSLDHNETLKKVVTGEPTPIEKKYMNGITITPKCVLLFNANRMPYLDGGQEAISSRYGIISFDNTFKVSPDPSKPNERKADPRFKDDQDFIEEYIAPALLKSLVNSYKSLMKEGIDYSHLEKTIQEAKKQSCHLYQFIENLFIVTSNSDVTSSRDLWESYKSWAGENGYLELDTQYEEDKIIFYDNSNFDKTCRSSIELSKRLQKVLPGMKNCKLDGNRAWNLALFSNKDKGDSNE